MFSWFSSWSEDQIFELIDKVDKKRKKERMQNKIINSSFAEDLKDAIKGVLILNP